MSDDPDWRGATLLAAAGVAAAASSASADTVLSVHYALTGTTFIKKLNTTVNLGSGTLAATVDLTTGTSSSTLSLPPAIASVKEFGIIPVTATAEMIQDGPASTPCCSTSPSPAQVIPST